MDDLVSTLQGAGPQPSQNAPQQSAPASSGFDPSKSYGTPTKLLDNLIHTESSGNPYAVNDKTGAMGPYQFMPSTLAMLAKKGVKFDPFDPTQARNAADYYIQQLKQQNGGTYEGALKAYGGFVTKDPSQYVGKVMNGVQPTMPGQSNQGDQPQGYQGPTSDLFSTLQAGSQQAQKTAQQPAPAPQQQPQQQPSAQQQKVASAMGLDPISSAADAAAVRGLSGLAGSVAGLGAGAWKALTTGGDFSAANQAWDQTAGKVSGAIESTLTPAGNAAAQHVGQAVADVPGQAIGAAVNAGGNVIDTAAQGMGASPQTAHKISELAKFGTNAGLTVLGTRMALKGREAPAQTTADAATATPQPNVADASAQPNAAAQPQAQPGVDASAKPRYRPNGDGTFTQVSPEPAQAGAQPAAQPGAAPVPAANLPQVSGKASDLFPAPDKSPTVAGALPPAEQANRKAVVQALGLDTVRDSVISGDAKQSGIEYENAKDGGPIGDVMSKTIAGEQNAIRNYANNIVESTGRDSMLDAEGVGQKILAPLQKMSDWFDQKAGDLYSQARDKAGNVPLAETPELTNLMGDLDLRDRMSASPDRQALYNAVQSRFARFAGLADQASEAADSSAGAPARTINNAENFRQWLNAVGRDNPQSGQFVGQVKRALDTDVAAAGGDGVFQQARSMWQQRQQMLEDPKSVGKLLYDPDSTGLNRKVATEKVGQSVMNMDGANFRNVLDSLNQIEKTAPELSPDVQGARSEIRGQAARQLVDAGGKTQYWNGAQFSKTAQTMAPKLKLIFSNDEMGALRTLNEAGRIIRQPGAYPGAAAQHMNMFRSGIATALPYVADQAGHFIAGPVGGLAGQVAGRKLANLVGKGGEAATAAKLAKRYSENARP